MRDHHQLSMPPPWNTLWAVLTMASPSHFKHRHPKSQISLSTTISMNFMWRILKMINMSHIQLTRVILTVYQIKSLTIRITLATMNCLVSLITTKRDINLWRIHLLRTTDFTQILTIKRVIKILLKVTYRFHWGSNFNKDTWTLAVIRCLEMPQTVITITLSPIINSAFVLYLVLLDSVVAHKCCWIDVGWFGVGLVL